MKHDEKALETLRRLRDVEERYWRIRLARVRREIEEKIAARDAVKTRLAHFASSKGEEAEGDLDLALREQNLVYRKALRRQLAEAEAALSEGEGERDEVLARLTDVARDGEVLSAVLEERRGQMKRRSLRKAEEEQENRGRGSARLERRLLMDD